ncbi:MAG: hypothetical protein AAF957_27945, partial [Planctomycetota bacterium]
AVNDAIAKALDAMPDPSAWSVDDRDGAFAAHLDPFAELIGPDLPGYRNHCLRVMINVRALTDPALDLAPVVPALAFHDIALWTHRTVDYLEPSAEVARAHLERIDRPDWQGPVEAMILWHHKQRRYSGPHVEYVEPVRRGDMGDFTFGLQGRVPRAALREGRGRYPNAGFHAMLTRRTVGRLFTKPWSPLPMMRW